MSGKSDVDSWLATVKDGGVLPERDLRILCEKIKEILIEESNVQPVSAPVTICGDIHGQFHDLLELFEKGGQLPDKRYLASLWQQPSHDTEVCKPSLINISPPGQRQGYCCYCFYG